MGGLSPAEDGDEAGGRRAAGIESSWEEIRSATLSAVKG